MLRAEFENNDKIAYLIPENETITSNVDYYLDTAGVDMGMRDSFICLVALYIAFLIASLLGLMFTTRRV